MFEIVFDLSDLERYAEQLPVMVKDQIPYAISLALNEAVFNARDAEINMWPSYVEQRSANFPRVALHVVEATKDNLEAMLIDTLHRANLLQHADGGIEKPLQAARLAIPLSGKVQMTAHGPRSDQKPINLKDSFVVDRGRGPVIYARTGRGKYKKIGAMYVIRDQATIKKDIPLRETFADTVREDLMRNLAAAMVKACLTRR